MIAKRFWGKLDAAQGAQELHASLAPRERVAGESGNAMSAEELPADTSDWTAAAIVWLHAAWSYWNEGSRAFERRVSELLNRIEDAADTRTDYIAVRARHLLARHYLRNGNPTRAAECLGDAAPARTRLRLAFLDGDCLEIRSLILTAQCLWDEALNAAAQAAAIHDDKTPDRLGRARALEATARAHLGLGDFRRAHARSQAALKAYAACKHTHGRIEVELLRAHICYHCGDFRRHERLLAQLETACQAAGFARGTATVHRYRAKAWLHEGKWRKAVKEASTGQALFDRLGAPDGCARCHLTLARACAMGRRWDEATAHNNEAQRTFHTLKDRAREAVAVMTQGLVEAARSPDDHEPATRLFKRALRVFSRGKPRDRRHLAAALFEIGDQYRKWSDFKTASSHLRRAVNEASTLGAQRLIDRYRAEERLVLTVKDYAEQALAACREREELRLVLQYVAHDLGNEVLGVTMGIGNLGRKLQVKAPLAIPKSDMDRLAGSAAYLRMLCGGLANASRDGRVPVFPATVDLRALVDEVFLMLGPRLTPEVQRLNHVREGTRVFADPDHVQRILANLVGNAADHTATGHVAVSAAATDDDNFVTIKVADTGTGIAKEDMDKVFDLYAQSREYDEETRNDARQRHGYGIGLAYCQEAVERHGGKIRVDPTATRTTGKDHGTTICFTLPKATPGLGNP